MSDDIIKPIDYAIKVLDSGKLVNDEGQEYDNEINWSINHAIGGLFIVKEILRADLVPQWQPIETAPKDGIDKIIRLPDGRAYTGWYAKGAWRMFGYNVDIIKVEPTHWMPLQKPPEVK